MRRQVYVARVHSPSQALTVDDTLTQWCRVASQLCMDLVVWRASQVLRSGNTVWGWSVRLAHAGMPLPSGEPLLGTRDDLVTALADTNLAEMLKRVNTASQRAEHA